METTMTTVNHPADENADRRPVGPILDRFAARRPQGSRARSSAETKDVIRRWIRPRFGQGTLGEMNSPAAIAGFIEELYTVASPLTGRPLSLGTVRRIIEVLRRILEMCLEDGLIAINGVRQPSVRRQLRPRPPAGEPDGRSWLTAAEARRYEAAAASVPDGDLCLFLLRSGLRVGEARGLLVSSLRLDGHRPWLEVSSQVDQANSAPGAERTEVVTHHLKTAAAHRRLDCDPVMERIIRARLAGRARPDAQAASGLDRGLVFSTVKGEPMQRHRLSQANRRICELAGVRPITLHGLRHTTITLLIHTGIPFSEIVRLARLYRGRLL
jgi:integrase